MSYARELDDLRREIVPGTAAGDVFTHYPKHAGVNVLVGSLATDMAPNPTYTVHDPSGRLLFSGTAVPSDVGDPATYSTLSLIIDSASIPSLTSNSALGEDYSVRVYWSVRDDDFQRIQVDIVWFDVVLYPFGPPSISLNDLMEERPDIGEVLHRMGLLLGYGDPDDEDDTSAEETMAGIFAVQARIELDSLVRNAVAEDASNAVSATSTLTSISRYTRPNLILSRDRLNRVERKLAMKLIMAADCKNPEDDSEAAGLLKYYDEQAKAAWKSCTPLKYDASEDLIPDSVISEVGRRWKLRRRQG